MIKKVVTITPESTVKQAADKMKKQGVSSLIVTRKKSVLGIITHHDLTVSISEETINQKVKDIMTEDVIFITPYECIIESINIMRGKRIKTIPVVDKNKLVGVITQTGIVEYIASETKKSNFEAALKKIKG